ncbi:acyl-CoA dehydrogenase family protein [Streptomyces xanthochromogenes]|uniref:acyl-CoA dehydrogenase family protein n=1 Tax=Streptomyces xanthochromogenes TaxID=67384 RepID=UPI0034306DDF
MVTERWLAATEDAVWVARAHAREVDAEARFPTEAMDALRRTGLLGLLVPVEHGGLGGGLEDMVQIASRLAGGCLSTALIWSMHCQQVDAVVRHGGPELRDELLPRIAEDGHHLASVTTEAGRGGHLLRAQSPLRQEVGTLRIERDAPVVTGGMAADGFLITMRADEDAAAHEVSLVYADRAQVKIEDGRSWSSLGMRGTNSAGMRISGSVPQRNLVGSRGDFRTVAVDSMIPLAHLGWAACWLGGARGLFREMLAAVRSRDWPLDVGSELVRERLARARMDLELVSSHLQRVCDEVARIRASGGRLDRPATQIHLNLLKVSAAELTFRAADRLMQLAGLTRGYLEDSPFPAERVFRDLRSAQLNNSDDRLLVVTGALVPLDTDVCLS